MNTATSKTELYAAASALYGMFAELNKSLPGHPLSHLDTLAAELTPTDAAALVRITRKLSDYRLNLDRNNAWAALEARCAKSLDLEAAEAARRDAEHEAYLDGLDMIEQVKRNLAAKSAAKSDLYAVNAPLGPRTGF